MSKHVETLIIGAGIVGTSAAYYLADYGATDVLVIDKGELFENDGSSSHAPGGVNPLSNNSSMSQLAADTIDLFETLPVFKAGRKPLYMVGGLDVARTDERMYEVKRLHSNAKGFGIDAHMVTPKEIEELFPLLRGDLFKGGIFTPRKPVVTGSHVCGSLTREAEKTGRVKFIGHTKATDFIVKNGRIKAVKTNNPELETITCERLLLCTNIWTPALTERLGINIPLMPAEHQYLKSEPLAELSHLSDRSSAEHELIYPSVRDMDGGLYYRHWWDSLGMGSYHHKPLMVNSHDLGEAAEHPFTEDDFVDAQKIAEESIPALKGKDYPYKINGMFSFSVDGLPILGETHIDGFWVASAVWVTNSGGVGKAMAQWMLTGEPEVDMRSLNVNRFLPYQKTKNYLHISCAKSYAEVHDVIHPAQSTSKPRSVRHTPFHARHEANQAEFTPSAGIEIPYWFNSNAPLLERYDSQIPKRTGWGAMHWSRLQGAEHLAMRETVGLMDLSSLAIIEVRGPDAEAFMNYACTNTMNIAVGRVTYTLLCTPKGGIKRDVAVSRKNSNTYWIFTGNGTLPQEIDWLERLTPNYDVSIHDLSQAYVAMGLFGPNARKVLEQLSTNALTNDAFPFYTWQTLEIGMASVYAMRISYVGELGWELHMKPDVALAVYDELQKAGQAYDLVNVGLGAMRSMRVEKGYRLWGADVHTEHNPYEAGMGWMVKLNKENFVGKEALMKLKQEPLKRKLVTVTLEHPNAVPTGNEPLFLGEDCIGQITSGNTSYSTGKYVAFAYLPPEHSNIGTKLELEYLAERFEAIVAEDVVFDPSHSRMKA